MRSKLATISLLCFVSSAALAGVDNPFKAAKAGDWVEYKMTGPNIEGKTKMIIVAADDKEVTYEVTSSFAFMGKEMTGPVQTLKVDLTKDYDAVSAANLKRTGTKTEKTGEGTEKIKIAGKEYDTKWKKLKSTTTTNGVTVVSEFKMWFAKDVPLSGLVKMETATAGTSTNMELTGSGRK